jgi:Uma2 family endonuclease
MTSVLPQFLDFGRLMSTQIAPNPPAEFVPASDIWRITVERYHQMVESGTITKNDRVELLDGILVPKMTISPAHAIGVDLVVDAIKAILPAGWCARSEKPFSLDDSEPEPDCMVARGSLRDYAARHPGATDVPLVIEVADSSLRRDREWKKHLYARNGIAVYWIVNLDDRVVEVFTDPSGPAPAPDYAAATTYGPADSVPVVLAGKVIGTVAVAAILP